MALHAAPPARRATTLLDVVPELDRRLTREQRLAVERALRVPVARLVDGADVDEAVSAVAARGRGRPVMGFVVSGAIGQRITLRGTRSLQILGPHDVFTVASSTAAEARSAKTVSTAYGPAQIGVISAQALAVATHWPVLTLGLHEHLLACRASAGARVAAAHLPRMEDRVLAALLQLSERFGHVAPAGVRLEIPLTHQTLGELAGGQRPTVTLAVAQLKRSGRVWNSEHGDWWLAHTAARGPGQADHL